MLTAMRRIVVFTREGREAFASSPVTQDAVVRNMEVIGEAAGKVSVEVREEHPEVPWSKMRGFASFAKHEYWRVEVSRVWAAVEQMPGLESQIAAIRVDKAGSRPKRTR
jgi:uncharacterized protein with HEPN domain